MCFIPCKRRFFLGDMVGYRAGEGAYSLYEASSLSTAWKVIITDCTCALPGLKHSHPRAQQLFYKGPNEFSLIHVHVCIYIYIYIDSYGH